MVPLESERLVLRDHTMDDLECYHLWMSDTRVMQHVGFEQSRSLAETREWLQLAVSEVSQPDRTRYFLAVTLKPDMEVVGDAGLRVLKTGEHGGIADLGYFLLPDYWGHGYATEAARMLIEFGFLELGMHKITAGCAVENRASERVMQKCGMEREGLLRKHRFRRGEWGDGLKYGLLREDWDNVK